MKVRLIQGGGILGRSKFAEEDLSAYSQSFQQTFDNFFSRLEKEQHKKDSNNMRDAFQYFIEYKNYRLQIRESDMIVELNTFFNKLMNKLHY